MRRSAHTARRQPFLMVIALILIAGFVAMIPFTYASAIDPTWLAGIYDDADYDEIVRLLTETSGVGTAPVHPAAESLTFITRIVVEGMNEPPQSAIPRSIQPRSPPTQTVSALLRRTRLISPSHSAVGASSVDSRDFAGALTEDRCTEPAAGWHIVRSVDDILHRSASKPGSGGPAQARAREVSRSC